MYVCMCNFPFSFSVGYLYISLQFGGINWNQVLFYLVCIFRARGFQISICPLGKLIMRPIWMIKGKSFWFCRHVTWILDLCRAAVHVDDDAGISCSLSWIVGAVKETLHNLSNSRDRNCESHPNIKIIDIQAENTCMYCELFYT